MTSIVHVHAKAGRYDCSASFGDPVGDDLCDIPGADRTRVADETGKRSGTTDDVFGRHPCRTKIADAGIAVRFAQLLRRRLHQQRMMEKLRRFLAAEKPRELNLAAGGRQEVVAANHQRHALDSVVHGDRELIGPVAIAVADEQIAALLGGPLLQRSMTEIVEELDRWLEPDTKAETALLLQVLQGAGARISEFALRRQRRRDITPRALTRVDQTARPKRLERVLVSRLSIALAPGTRARSKCLGRRIVRDEPEPVQVVENRALEFRTAPLPIVVL